MENTNDFFKGQIPTIILNVLSTGDKYGYEIIKDVEDKSNGKILIKQPSLYSCLKRLEAQKLITSYWMDSDIGGKRHYYRITDMGRKQMEYNQATLESTTQHISSLSSSIKESLEKENVNSEFSKADEVDKNNEIINTENKSTLAQSEILNTNSVNDVNLDTTYSVNHLKNLLNELNTNDNDTYNYYNDYPIEDSENTENQNQQQLKLSNIEDEIELNKETTNNIEEVHSSNSISELNNFTETENISDTQSPIENNENKTINESLIDSTLTYFDKETDNKIIGNKNIEKTENLVIDEQNNEIDYITNDNTENIYHEIKSENVFTSINERNLEIEKAKEKLNINNTPTFDFNTKAFLQYNVFETNQPITITPDENSNIEKITLNTETIKDSTSYDKIKDDIFKNKSFYDYEKDTTLNDKEKIENNLNTDLYNTQNHIYSEVIISENDTLNSINSDKIKEDVHKQLAGIISPTPIKNTNNVQVSNEQLKQTNSNFNNIQNDESILDLTSKDENVKSIENSIDSEKNSKPISFAESNQSNSRISSFITETITDVPKVKKISTPSLDIINNSAYNLNKNQNNKTEFYKGYYSKYENHENIKSNTDEIKPINIAIKNNHELFKSSKPKTNKNKILRKNFVITNESYINYNLFNVAFSCILFILSVIESSILFAILKSTVDVNKNFAFLYILLPCLFLIATIIYLIIYSTDKTKRVQKSSIKYNKFSTTLLTFILVVIISFGLALSTGLIGSNISQYLTLLVLPPLLSLNFIFSKFIKLLLTKSKFIYFYD